MSKHSQTHYNSQRERLYKNPYKLNKLQLLILAILSMIMGSYIENKLIESDIQYIINTNVELNKLNHDIHDIHDDIVEIPELFKRKTSNYHQRDIINYVYEPNYNFRIQINIDDLNDYFNGDIGDIDDIDDIDGINQLSFNNIVNFLQKEGVR